MKLEDLIKRIEKLERVYKMGRFNLYCDCGWALQREPESLFCPNEGCSKFREEVKI